MGFTGDVFTWCNRKDMGAQVILRLDRFLANANFCSLFENYQVKHLNWAKLDHRPIQLSLEEVTQTPVRSKGYKAFRFEEWWTRLEDC